MSDVDELLRRIRELGESEHSQQSKNLDDLLDKTDRLIAGQAAQHVINGAGKLMADPTPAVTE